MKTIGTVINTIVVVFGMLCSLIAGAFVGYSMAKDEKTNYPSSRSYTQYRTSNSYSDLSRVYFKGHKAGYREGWDDCRESYNTEKETEENEDIGEA